MEISVPSFFAPASVSAHYGTHLITSIYLFVTRFVSPK